MALESSSPRSPGITVMIYVNCISLVVCGFFGFLGNIFNFLNLTYPVLAIYVIIFGIMAASAQFRFSFATSYFGFLIDWLGASLFYIFVGTIGVCFISNSLILFLAGVYSCVVGVGCIVDHFACKTHTVEDTIRPI